MHDSKLTNDNKVQVVALKLDKTKSRELAFRVYLDQNELDGINRKESILRLFEYAINSGNEYLVSSHSETDAKSNNKTDPKIDKTALNMDMDIDDLDGL